MRHQSGGISIGINGAGENARNAPPLRRNTWQRYRRHRWRAHLMARKTRQHARNVAANALQRNNINVVIAAELASGIVAQRHAH